MDRKFPTIEALDAAFSAHYESLTPKDREKQARWYMNTFQQSKWLKAEIRTLLVSTSEYIDTERKQFCFPGDAFARMVMGISAELLFIGWPTRGGIEDKKSGVGRGIQRFEALDHALDGWQSLAPEDRNKQNVFVMDVTDDNSISD